MKTSYFFNYGRRFILFFVFLLLLTILLCYRVDPFSIYGRVYTKDGHEVNSPGFTSQLHMGKSAAIKRYKPNIIIMGSSRAAFGLSASSSEKYFPQQNVYNMAFPGASAYESLCYFQHAIASSDIKQAFISLDFFQYHGGRALPSSFREERLAVDINNQSTNDPVNDYLSTLLSADAVFYSFKVATGLCDWKSIYLTNGFKYQDLTGAWAKQFISSEQRYIDDTYTIPDYTFNNKNDSGTTFDYFRKMVQLAHQHHIDLHFFISPSHARQWEVIAQLGLWQKWEYWKQEMLAITKQESRIFQQSILPIHDFSGYSAYSTESVPRTAEKVMQWYSDSSHYRQALGDILLAKMLQIDKTPAESFGRVLNTANITMHLANIKTEHLHYQTTHTQDITDIQQLIAAKEKY